MSQNNADRIAVFLRLAITEVQSALGLPIVPPKPTDIWSAKSAYGALGTDVPDESKQEALEDWIRLAEAHLEKAATVSQALVVYNESPSGSTVENAALQKAVSIASDLASTATSADQMSPVTLEIINALDPDTRDRFIDRWIELCTNFAEISTAYGRAANTKHAEGALRKWIELCGTTQELDKAYVYVAHRSELDGLFQTRMDTLIRSLIEGQNTLVRISTLHEKVGVRAPSLLPLIEAKWDTLVKEEIPTISSIQDACNLYIKARADSEAANTVLEVWVKLGLEAVENTNDPAALKDISLLMNLSAHTNVRKAIITKLAGLFTAT